MKDGSSAPIDHPWRRQSVNHVRKTEEDLAAERFDNVDDRLDQQLERDSEKFGSINE